MVSNNPDVNIDWILFFPLYGLTFVVLGGHFNQPNKFKLIYLRMILDTKSIDSEVRKNVNPIAVSQIDLSRFNLRSDQNMY